MLTTEQLVQRWEDQRNIKNLMGKYCNIVILNREGGDPGAILERPGGYLSRF